MVTTGVFDSGSSEQPNKTKLIERIIMYLNIVSFIGEYSGVRG